MNVGTLKRKGTNLLEIFLCSDFFQTKLRCDYPTNSRREILLTARVDLVDDYREIISIQTSILKRKMPREFERIRRKVLTRLQLFTSHSVSNLSLRGLEGTWTGAEVSSLRRDVSLWSSNTRSQSFSNCLLKGLVAALNWRATFFDVMGVLKLVAALLTSLISFPSELWVS